MGYVLLSDMSFHVLTGLAHPLMLPPWGASVLQSGETEWQSQCPIVMVLPF